MNNYSTDARMLLDFLISNNIIAADEWPEYFANSIDDTSIAQGTGAAFEDTNIRLDQDADFLISSRSYVATYGNILLRLQDQSNSRYMFSNAADLRTIAGRSIQGSTVGGDATEWLFFTMPLACPYRVIRGANILMQAADNANTGTNSLRLTLHGAKVRKGRAPWLDNWPKRIPFDYTDVITVAANGVSQLTIPLNQDSHFLAYSCTFSATSGLFTAQITDGSSDRYWSNVAVHGLNMFGNGQMPHILEAPRMVYQGTSLRITLTDLSGSSNVIRLTFSGEKLFTGGSY